MRGWLFQQGKWDWGVVITWHVVVDHPLWTMLDDDDLYEPTYCWVAYLWKLNPDQKPPTWHHEGVLDTDKEVWAVEDWMVHEWAVEL